MGAPVTLGLDGVVYRRSAHGGVARTFDELLPILCALDPDLSVDVYVEGAPLRPLPDCQGVRAVTVFQADRILRPHRLMVGCMPVARAYAYACAARRRRLDVWQTTNYNIPAWWRGPTVVSVYDLIYRRYPEHFPAGARRRFVVQQEAAVRAADAIIVNSVTTKQDVIKFLHVPESRVTVAHLAASSAFRRLEDDNVPLASPSIATAIESIGTFLLLVGARAGYKNGAAVLRAYSSWQGRKDVALVLAGPPLDDFEIGRAHV